MAILKNWRLIYQDGQLPLFQAGVAAGRGLVRRARIEAKPAFIKDQKLVDTLEYSAGDIQQASAGDIQQASFLWNLNVHKS
jgi:hypothetical protein